MTVGPLGPVGMLNGSVSNTSLLADKAFSSTAYQLTHGMNGLCISHCYCYSSSSISSNNSSTQCPENRNNIVLCITFNKFKHAVVFLASNSVRYCKTTVLIQGMFISANVATLLCEIKYLQC